MRPISLATNRVEKHRKQMPKAEFLSRIGKLVSWEELCAVIEPFYPKAGNSMLPIGLGRMLRMYFIAYWFNLTDEACEDTLYDIAAYRDFCRIDLGCKGVQKATRLLGFYHMLEERKLGAAVFTKIGEQLYTNELRLSGGTIVVATIIAVPSLTKNADRACDPEMHQIRKGNQRYFGMKVHIGADCKSGLAHSASATSVSFVQEHLRVCQGTLLRPDEERPAACLYCWR